MTTSLFSVAILLIFFSVTALEVYRGIKKGFRKSLISLAVTLASIVGAIIFSHSISKLVTNAVLDFVVKKIQAYDTLISNYPSMSTLILALAQMILSAFLLLASFFIARAIIGGLVSLICKSNIAKIPDTPSYAVEKNSFFDRNEKALSVIVSIITAFMVTTVITSPIMGTLDIAKRSLRAVEKANKQITSTIGEDNISALTTYADDLTGNFFYQLGGKLIYREAASTKVYGNKVYLLSEVEAITEANDDFLDIYKILRHPENAKDDHIESIYSLCDNINKSELCALLFADVLPKGAAAWQRGNTFLNIPRPTMNALIDPAVDEVLSVFADTNYQSAKLNIITLLKIYATIIESDIVSVDQSDFNAVLKRVDRSGLIEKLDAILDENPYTSSISVSSISMAAVARHLRQYDYDVVKYDDLMNNISDAVNNVNSRGYATVEERADVLATYAKKHITDYGVSIPDDVASSVAEELLLCLPNESVSTDDIKEVFLKYSN